ncbi:phage tail protein [Ancylobacter sp. FA202]|uniref:phage tail protein n=1 Tax=Ancylobacter sp. FA202 TaxID=1111106 RepID=UPI00037406DC|nr:tail fiber protein [Ancylobacter sp. FA202]
MDAYVGEIRAFAFGFALDGEACTWLPCNGAVLSARQYPVLYAVIGIAFGTQGTDTFCLPDLTGRVAIGARNNMNDAGYVVGQRVGEDDVTVHSVPAHRHTVEGKVVISAPYAGLSDEPSPTRWLSRPTRLNAQNSLSAGTISRAYGPPGAAPERNTFDNRTLTPVGGTAQPHENRQPYLAINYCICAKGLLPYHTSGAAAPEAV